MFEIEEEWETCTVEARVRDIGLAKRARKLSQGKSE